MLKTRGNQAAEPKEVMHKFVDLFMAGQWDDFGQVIAADCVLHYPGGAEVVGLDAMKAGWKVFYGALADLKITLIAEVTEGDMLVEFMTMEARYTGDHMGREVVDTPVRYNQVEVVRIVGGKIVEWWVEMDRLWMSQQLGFQFEPE